jgi:uncharacterized protein YndB with AHSA1/START domain
MTERSLETARVTTFVAVDPELAFDVFTRETDLWWRRGMRFRGGGEGSIVRFEGERPRRLVEVSAGGETFVIGRVLAWEPGLRLALEWRSRAFTGDEVTHVDVRFEAASGGTRVTIEHAGWEAIPKEHRVRHGLAGAAFAAMMGMWWGDLATTYRMRAAPR